MKTTPFLEYIIYDIFGENEPITFKSMMGAYILRYEGKAFAIIKDEELYFKGPIEIKDRYLSQGSKQFMYQRNGEDCYLHYFLVPPKIYEDKTLLDVWFDVALSVAKPPKPKKKRKVQ